MLPAPRRVRHPADFATTVRDGRRARSSGLVVHARQTAADLPARAGFVVGRAVGPAVRRNRLRRQLRHMMAARLDALPRGLDLVVRVLPTAATLDRDELQAMLDAALDRAVRAETAR